MTPTVSLRGSVKRANIDGNHTPPVVGIQVGKYQVGDRCVAKGIRLRSKSISLFFKAHQEYHIERNFIIVMGPPSEAPGSGSRSGGDRDEGGSGGDRDEGFNEGSRKRKGDREAAAGSGSHEDEGDNQPSKKGMEGSEPEGANMEEGEEETLIDGQAGSSFYREGESYGFVGDNEIGVDIPSLLHSFSDSSDEDEEVSLAEEKKPCVDSVADYVSYFDEDICHM